LTASTSTTPIRKEKKMKKLEKMTAHKGVCDDCHGPVKMPRDEVTLELLPRKCFCLRCGQRYFMEIEDLEAWEVEQWQQKSSLY
jgi:hypothetical protein